MKGHALLMPLALLIGAAPGTARVYACTADGAQSAERLRFGAGEYSVFDSSKGAWGANFCASATDCTFKGNVFNASFGPNFFTFNTATRRYILADIFGDVTARGKCVLE